MLFRSLLAPLAVGLVLLSASVTADAGWQHNVAHKHVSGKTSLKITGADGLKAQVTIDGTQKEDTIPAVFTLSDHDAFVPVTITAADGKVFSQKIEVKAHQQTDLVVKYEAEQKPGAAAPGRKYLGHAGNLMSRCREPRELKMDFLRSADGANAGSVQLKADSSQNVEITAGQYDVRIFSRNPGATSDFTFWRTEKLEVTADEWIFAFGCRSKREAPGRLNSVSVR